MVTELLRLVDAALSSFALSTREGGDDAQGSDEAEGSFRRIGTGALVSSRFSGTLDSVSRLMYALIDVVEREVHDGQDQC